jgi:hypothetical protein
MSISSLPSIALLLRGQSATAEDRNLTRLLEFFDIPCKTFDRHDAAVDEVEEQYAILSSVDCILDALNGADSPGQSLPPWIMKARSVYIYGFHDDERSTKLLRSLTGGPQARVRPISVATTTVTVAGGSPEICGAMTGMRVPITLRSPGCVFDVGPESNAIQGIVRSDEGYVVLAVTYRGVRFYLNAWERTIDISAISAKYFDVKHFFCEAVPIVFYLKWAFRETARAMDETSACLIVDDPPLKRRYGFLDFREALNLMQQHNFTSTIAFIPWNWRRTYPRTLSIFQKHPERFSLVVHGCDHTKSEFAVRSTADLNKKIQISLQRIERFQRRASIDADRVMVFPQGQFSVETGRALKLNGFVAAVNTEVAPAQESTNETTIADLWNVAIMKYGTFPIFTRRYLHHGIENFAFDALLGKPCLIAAHHEVFKDHARDLVDFVRRLNSLKWNLVWRPLGEVVRRGFTSGRLDDGTRVVQMFACSLVLENQGSDAQKTLLMKEELDPDSVESVQVNQAPVEFSVEGGYLRAWLTAVPGETTNVRITYRNPLEAISGRVSSKTKIKVAVNRYLSEFRDNYLSRSEFLYQSAYRLKHLMK